MQFFFVYDRLSDVGSGMNESKKQTSAFNEQLSVKRRCVVRLLLLLQYASTIASSGSIGSCSVGATSVEDDQRIGSSFRAAFKQREIERD